MACEEVNPFSLKCRVTNLQLGSYVYLELLKMADGRGFVCMKDFYLKMSQFFKFSKAQSRAILRELQDEGLVRLSRGKIFLEG